MGIGHILRRNSLLKCVIEGYMWREDEEDDLRIYWMTFRDGGDSGNEEESLDRTL
jgi:hypothetical protein